MPVTKPTNLFRWATGGVGGTPGITEPPEGKKDLGWTGAEKPAAQFFNWLGNGVYQWIAYLNDLQDQAITWNALQTFAAGFSVSRTVTAPAISSGFSAAPSISMFTDAMGMTHIYGGLLLPAGTAYAAGASVQILSGIPGPLGVANAHAQQVQVIDSTPLTAPNSQIATLTVTGGTAGVTFPNGIGSSTSGSTSVRISASYLSV